MNVIPFPKKPTLWQKIKRFIEEERKLAQKYRAQNLPKNPSSKPE